MAFSHCELDERGVLFCGTAGSKPFQFVHPRIAKSARTFCSTDSPLVPSRGSALSKQKPDKNFRNISYRCFKQTSYSSHLRRGTSKRKLNSGRVLFSFAVARSGGVIRIPVYISRFWNPIEAVQSAGNLKATIQTFEIYEAYLRLTH